MKNKYFGDVNDYRKYGLLRALIEASGLDLGVCWMLTPDDGRTDGEFRRYLDNERRWRHHDPDLFDALRQLRNGDVTRDVRLADEWNLLPGASYFDLIVPELRNGRAAYFEAAMSALPHAPVLFFDPDNGFEVKSVPVGARDSSKYLLWSEVGDAFSRGHSVIVYQHFPRQPRAAFIEAIAGRLHERLGAPLVASYTTAHVVFFLASRPEHVERLAGARELVARRWSGQIRASTHALRDSEPADLESRTMNAIQYAQKIADGMQERDADSVSDVPVNVGDEEIVKEELERRGFKVSMVPTYLDAARTHVARYVLTVSRH